MHIRPAVMNSAHSGEHFHVRIIQSSNNLLELIAADPAFNMSLEELKETMEPQKYVGRAKEQVESYLNNVIYPLLEENKEILGVKAEINV